MEGCNGGPRTIDGQTVTTSRVLFFAYSKAIVSAIVLETEYQPYASWIQQTLQILVAAY